VSRRTKQWKHLRKRKVHVDGARRVRLSFHLEGRRERWEWGTGTEESISSLNLFPLERSIIDLLPVMAQQFPLGRRSVLICTKEGVSDGWKGGRRQKTRETYRHRQTYRNIQRRKIICGPDGLKMLRALASLLCKPKIDEVSHAILYTAATKCGRIQSFHGNNICIWKRQRRSILKLIPRLHVRLVS